MKKRFLALALFALLFVLVFTFTACGGGGGSSSGKEDCNHSWREEIPQAATCTDKGTKLLICDICGESRKEGIDPLGHDIEVVKGKAATCLEGGLTDGEFCNRCNRTIKEQSYIPTLNHTEVVDAAVNATCSLGGLTEGLHCSVCETVLIEQRETDPLGHSWTYPYGFDATCTEAGLTNGQHCTRCDHVEIAQVVIPAKGHTEVTDKGYAASCTEAGLTDGKHCSVCSDVLVEQVAIEATGHKIVSEGASSATCKSEGATGGKSCSTCKVVFETSSTIAKVDHKFENGSCVYCQLTHSQGLEFADVSNTTCEVVGIGSFSGTEIVVPDKHDNKDVVGIADGAFEGETTITKIVITGKLEYIGENAFKNCVSLKVVTLPKSVTEVESGAFDGCEELEEIKCEDFAQTDDWASDYLGSSNADISADKKDGLTAFEIYVLAMQHINTNLDKYIADDHRVLTMDDIPGADAQTQFFLSLLKMDIKNHIEYSNGEFYIKTSTKSKDYQYDYQGYPIYGPNGLPVMVDKTVTNQYWYYDGIFWALEPGTSQTGKTVLRIGQLYLYDLLSMSTSGAQNYVFTEKFFTGASFTKNDNGYLLSVDVSGDALTEFLIAMSSASMGDTFEQLGFSYDDVTYYYYFDANGNIESIYVNAGFSFGAEAAQQYEGLTGNVVITQTYSEVGTLNSIKTKPIGNGFSNSDIPAANPSCTHPSYYQGTVAGYAATCTTDGLSDGKYCRNCRVDVQLPEVIPASHTLENGVCTVCGHNTTLTEGLVYEYNSDGKTATLVGLGNCRDEEIVIPEDIHGIVITKIAKDAFKGATFVKSIKIPAGVAVIEDGALDGLTNLKKVSLSTLLVNKLPKSIVEIEITSGETIKAGSFVDFKYLTTITLNSCVKEIEDGAFVGCDRLFVIYNFSEVYIYSGNDSPGGIGANALSIITSKYQTSNITVVGDFVFQRSSSGSGSYSLVKYLGNAENLVLPESVNGEGYYITSEVFSDVSCIKTIVGPATIKGVASDAFEETPSVITSVCGNAYLISAVPVDNLQYVEVIAGSMDSYFMDYAPELVEAKIHVNVTNSSFERCPKLEKLTFTDSVTAITGTAFTYCESLKEIRLGNGVNSIGSSTFSGNSDLAIYVEDAKVLARISGNGYYWYYVSDIYVNEVLTRDLTINGITSIANYAFANCKAIDSITFGAGLEIVGEYAFYASSIEEVEFNSGLTSINRFAFANTEELESVTLPDTIRNIENNAFYYAEALEYINLPEGLTSIGSACFKYATSLRSVVIPSSLTEIPTEAFYNAKSLTSVTVLSKNVNGNVSGATKIGYSAFYGCDTLATVTLGDSVVEIEGSAFYGAYKLSSLDLGSVETIGSYAFYKCESLKSLELPSNLKTIGSSAFAYVGTHTVTLPASLTTLGSDSFYNANGLVEVVNNSTISISASHSSCVAKYALVITTGESTIDYVSGFAFLNVPSGTYAGINLVGYFGDDKCITLPENYNGNQYRIGKYAFANTDLASVVISSGVTHISAYAFYNCRNLVSITIGENVVESYANAFSGCSIVEVIKLTSKSISLPSNYDVLHSGETMIDFTDDGFAFYTNSDGEVYLVAYIGDEISITLPELYNEKPYSIYEFAFYYLSLKEVYVPETLISLGADFIDINTVKTNVYEGVMYLGNEENPYVIALGPVNNNNNLKTLKLHDDTVMIAREAFRYQRSLESVEFGNSLRVISYAAFDGCNYLKEVILPDTVVRIEDYAFQDCYDVTTLYLGENLEYIGYHAFYYMSDLKELTIPAKVKYIGIEAFTQCCSLEKIYYNAINVEYFGSRVFNIDSGYSRKEITVVIGDGVERIPDYAFGGSSASPSVTSITVTDFSDLKYIGSYAFGANCKLENLDLPNVEYVGDGAFAGSTALKTVKLINAKSIGSSAFLNCTSLTSVEIGNATIGAKAFSGCTALKTAKLGGGSSFISNYAAFSGCSALESIALPLENVTILDVFGVNYAYSIPSTLTKVELLGSKVYTKALQDCTKITELVIASTVTEIGSYAFEGMTGITELDLPEGLKTVGDCAFENCSNLKSLVIPRGVESMGYYILRGATKLESLEMPFLGKTKDSVTTLVYFVPASNNFSSNSDIVSTLKTLKLTNVSKLCSGALAYTNYLETVIIEGEIKEIPKQCFDSSKALKSVTLPEGVETLSASAFYNCKKLETLNLPSSIKSIAIGALYNLQSIKSLELPEGATIEDDAIGFDETVFAAMDKSVFTYYENAYYLGTESNEHLMLVGAENTDIETCKIASTTKYILPYAFYNCTKLTSIEIPASVTTIGSHAFQSSGLTEIVIPDTVTELGDNVFGYCSSLASVSIGSGIKVVPDHAFYGCNKLKTVNFSANIEKISMYAFYNTNIEKVNIPTLLDWLEIDNSNSRIFGNDTGLYIGGELLTELTIPEGITTFGSNAFYNYKMLKKATLANDLEEIPASAFSNCTNLETVIFGENVTTIGASAFYYASNCYIFIPKTVTTVGSQAFSNISADHLFIEFRKDEIPTTWNSGWTGTTAKNNANYGSKGVYVDANGVVYGILSDSTATALAYRGTSTDIVLPDTIGDNYRVTKMYASAFKNCGITSFTAGKHFTRIPESAFSGCTTLVSVDLSACMKMDIIYNYAFKNCSNLETVKLPVDKSESERAMLDLVGTECFYRCSKLANINIIAIRASIGERAFYECTSITSASIKAATVLTKAFYNCSALTSVEFLNTNFTTITSECFANCGIKDLVIPDKVTTIEPSAFYRCPLETLVIGSGVKSIGASAFAGTFNNLTSVTFKNVSGWYVNDNTSVSPSETDLSANKDLLKTHYAKRWNRYGA